MNRTFSFILNHPLGRRRPVASLARWAGWQMTSRVAAGDLEVDWIGGLRLAARNGMTGITGNLYVGLHEFVDMAFVLHFLRDSDTFFDIGANVGSYSLLASGLRKAKTSAFEPDPDVFGWLTRNIELNGLADRISANAVALGETRGQASFTVGLDTVNHVISGNASGAARTVVMHRLDDYADRNPALLKIDVEGFEHSVLLGGAGVLKSPSLHAIIIETVTDESAALLANAGFSRVYYDPFTRTLSAAPTYAQASNELFVRNQALVAARLREAPVIDVWGLKV